VDITEIHVRDINNWISRHLIDPEAHFLHNWDDDWMLYGTGTAQLTYLAVLDAVAEIALQHQSMPIKIDRIAYRRTQVSGNKDVLPNVSNYWIQFKKRTVGIERTGDPSKPIRLVGGEFGTKDSMKFFDSFNASVFSLGEESYSKIVAGLKKQSASVPDAPKLRDHEVQNFMRMYAVRRACKFLLYESIGNGMKIRYVLDDLNLEMAATKARVEGKVPVCTTELREIFRCWDYFRNHVTFYKDFRLVTPPWERPTATYEGLKGWAMYAAHRANKVLSDDATTVLPQALVKLEACVEAALQGNYPRAIWQFHESCPSLNSKFLKPYVIDVSVEPEF